MENKYECKHIMEYQLLLKTVMVPPFRYFVQAVRGARQAEMSSKQHRRLVVQFAGQDDTYSVSLFVLATRIQICRGCLKHVSQ